MFKIKVWNGDLLKNKHIKITSRANGIGSKIVSSTISLSNTTNLFYGSYKLLNLNMDVVRWYTNPNLARAYSTKATVPSIKAYSQKRVKALNNSPPPLMWIGV